MNTEIQDRPADVSGGQRPAYNRTLKDIDQIIERSEDVIKRLHAMQFRTSEGKTLDRRYTISEVAELIGRSTTAIRKVEASGQLAPPEKTESGRRVGYTLEQVNALRDHFGIAPGRTDHERPFRLSFQNFKGGVGKSTMSTHFAQYLAQKGYRVLLVDCDSQGSCTTTFGVEPDLELDADDTLLPFFEGDTDSLAYAIKPTYWDRLDIIPANLELYGAEYSLASQAGGQGAEWISRLHNGLMTVEQSYDVVILDPPPALGMISLNVARSLNGLIVPTPPSMYDYHSTVTFFRMLREVLEVVNRTLDQPLEFDFIKLLVSKYDAGKSAQEFLAQMLGERYAGAVLRTPLLQSAEIDNASSNWQTVYELTGATSSRNTYKRCINSLDAVFGEVELLIRSTWVSHRVALQSEGHSFLAW